MLMLGSLTAAGISFCELNPEPLFRTKFIDHYTKGCFLVQEVPHTKAPLVYPMCSLKGIIIPHYSPHCVLFEVPNNSKPPSVPG